MNLYPLTIISDRYTGSYSGGEWTAWNLYPQCIPEEVDFGDIECSEFWHKNTIPVGIGNTPEEAVKDLIKKLSIRTTP